VTRIRWGLVVPLVVLAVCRWTIYLAWPAW
jgi:hypothetical protein